MQLLNNKKSKQKLQNKWVAIIMINTTIQTDKQNHVSTTMLCDSLYLDSTY